MEIEEFALNFATKAHDGQLRKGSKTPYIKHPKRVAALVRKHPKATKDMIAAAYLHDTVEDCPGITIGMIRNEFGNRISKLVGWLTNEKHKPNLPRAERKRLDRERLAKAPAEAKIIKLLDRIDNLSDGAGLDENFKKLYAQESILLAEVLKDADEGLAKELVTAAKKLENE